MFFVLECFLVTLFSALFLAGLFTDAPVFHYGTVCFSASLWLKMSEKYAFRFSIVFSLIFVFWSFAIDAELGFFIPVLITAGFPFIIAARSREGKTSYTMRYRNNRVVIADMIAAVLLSCMEFLRFHPVFFCIYGTYFFYSAVKTSYKDTEELMMTMKDVLTENRIEDETQQRLLRSNARKNSEVTVLANGTVFHGVYITLSVIRSALQSCPQLYFFHFGKTESSRPYPAFGILLYPVNRN